MNVETGDTEWRNLKQEEDPVKVLGAAICVPGVSSVKSVNLGGKEYVDGAFSTEPLLKKIFEMGYTDVVVLSNDQFGKVDQPHLISGILGEIGKNGYDYNEKMRLRISAHGEAAKIKTKQVWEGIEKGDSDRRVAIMDLAPDSERIQNLEINPEKIKGGYEKARLYAGRVFDPDIPLGEKPKELKSAGEELKAMGASGKPVEAKLEGAVNQGLEASKRVEELEKELWKYINNEQLMVILKGIGKLEGRGKSTIDNVYDRDDEYNVRVMGKIMDLVKRRGIQTFVERDYKPANPLTRNEKVWKFATNELPILTTMVYGLESLGIMLGPMTASSRSKDPVVYALLKDYKSELKNAKKAKDGWEEAQKMPDEKKLA